MDAELFVALRLVMVLFDAVPPSRQMPVNKLFPAVLVVLLPEAVKDETVLF